MTISTLSIENHRCFDKLSLVFDSKINLITGANGAGKTTILEAIYLLGRGKSFRTARTKELIRDGSEALRVVGKIGNHDTRQTVVGIQHDGAVQLMRVGGTAVSSRISLNESLSIQFIGPEVHKLLEGGPQNRRQFLDLGLFHVEHNYLGCWQRYIKALRQRNAALRKRSADEVSIWDVSVSETGERLSEFRQSYIRKLQPLFSSQLSSYPSLTEIELSYRRGWKDGESLDESLDRNRPVDLKERFTHSGPHRAELRFLQKGVPVQHRVSRGQQKLVAAGLLLAQLELQIAALSKPTVLLVDDLPSELDSERRTMFLEQIDRLDVQKFITATSADLLPTMEQEKMFHVEPNNTVSVLQ